MKSFACLLFLLPTLALAQDYLGQNHPRVRIYASGNDYISNVVGDIVAAIAGRGRRPSGLAFEAFLRGQELG